MASYLRVHMVQVRVVDELTVAGRGFGLGSDDHSQMPRIEVRWRFE